MSHASVSPIMLRRPTWLLLGAAGLASAAAAVLLLAPELPRSLLAGSPTAPPLGEAPLAIGAVSGELAEHDPRPAMPEIGRWVAAPAAMPVLPATGATAAPPQAPLDDARSVELLAEAERRYAGMEWDLAASLAERIHGLPSRPGTAQRAAGIARGAVALKRLFQVLDQRDELRRNWDTHPSLLARDDGERTELLVPLVSFAEPLTAVLDDPLGWTERVRSANSPGCFLLKAGSSFSKAHIVPGSGQLRRVDQQALSMELGRQLDRMLARIAGDAVMREDPNSWYEAGKFAYRNRLDSRVTPLLDQAFRLDPDLAATVREGNAEALFGVMVGHLKHGNRQQAASFMKLIDQSYADTRQGRLARLYYDGRTGELLAAVREPVAGAQPTAPRQQDDAPAAAPPADLARARQLFAEGSRPYYQATGMPATEARNQLYHQASLILRQAKAAYAAWCAAHPEDDAAAAEGLEASQQEAAARKYATL